MLKVKVRFFVQMYSYVAAAQSGEDKEIQQTQLGTNDRLMSFSVNWWAFSAVILRIAVLSSGIFRRKINTRALPVGTHAATQLPMSR